MPLSTSAVSWKDPRRLGKLHVAGLVCCGQAVAPAQGSKAQSVTLGWGQGHRAGQASKRLLPRYEKGRAGRRASFLLPAQGLAPPGRSLGAKGISTGHFREPHSAPQHVKAHCSATSRAHHVQATGLLNSQQPPHGGLRFKSELFFQHLKYWWWWGMV